MSSQNPRGGGQYRCSKCQQVFDSLDEKRKHEREEHQQKEQQSGR